MVREGKDPFESDVDAPLLLDKEEPDLHRDEMTDDVAFEGMDPLPEALEKEKK